MTLETQPNKELGSLWPKRVLYANPHGFCAGVVRSVDTSRNLIARFPNQKVYYVGEPAHNTHVVKEFEDLGYTFVQTIEDVPDGNPVALGPHGSPPQDLQIARKKGLVGIDTQCPLVTKVHKEAERYIEHGFKVLYFGKKGHAETRGVMGYDPDGKSIILFDDQKELINILETQHFDPEKVAFISQTTHAASKAKQIQEFLQTVFPNIKVPKVSDICYATENRQNAVRAIVKEGAQAVVVVGSKHSSNSKELNTVAEEAGAKGIFVDSANELQKEVFYGLECIGLTSGASVLEKTFQDVMRWFRLNGSTKLEAVTIPNNENLISFGHPELKKF